MNIIKLPVVNSKGHLLNAHLEIPTNQKPEYYAIFAHCFTCTSNLNAIKYISRALAIHGFGVVRFDFTGLGSSEGAFTESHFSSNVQDLIDVSSYMKEHLKAPSLLVGHSLGGAASIVAGAKIDSVKAIATIGAPSKISHVLKHFSQTDEGIDGDTEINIGGRPFIVNKDFIKDFKLQNLSGILKKMMKPLLIMHSEADAIVPLSNAHDIYKNANHPKSFISLGQADHLLLKSEDSFYVGNMIGAWVSRYFPMAENKMPDTNGEQIAAHLNLTEDNYTTYLQTKKHSFVADEPTDIGADDFGPSPYDYLNAALAACTTMTLKVYAARKGWPLDDVYVYITRTKKHSDDLDIEVSKPGLLDYITKRIKLIGDLDEMQKEKLKEIAEKCPVHRTLKGEVAIDTSLMD